jgi:hypothetical protein
MEVRSEAPSLLVLLPFSFFSCAFFCSSTFSKSFRRPSSCRKSLQSVLITALGFSSIDVGLQQQLSRWRISEILLD